MEYVVIALMMFNHPVDTVSKKVEKDLTNGTQKVWTRKQSDTTSSCASDTLVFRLSDHKYAHTNCMATSKTLNKSWSLEEKDDEHYIRMGGKVFVLDIFFDATLNRETLRLRIKGTSLDSPATDILYHSNN